MKMCLKNENENFCNCWGIPREREQKQTACHSIALNVNDVGIYMGTSFKRELNEKKKSSLKAWK